MESCYINLFFLYRSEAIFNQHFNAAHTIDTELRWCHMLELQANFKVPTYEVVGGALAPVDKEHMGICPKMLLFALDKLSSVYQCIDNTDVQHVIAYEMLSFASHRCMEPHDGRPKPECDTHGPAMPHVKLGDLEASRGLPGLFTTGCMSWKISPHLQARMTGPASSTKL